MKSRILITGGCGKIGSYFTRFAMDDYLVRIVDQAAWDTQSLGPPPGEILQLDLQNLDNCRKACEGMQAVIHLAADGDPKADFYASLLGNNIVATYNMFRAAKDAGCQRFIFASSIHAVSAYPQEVKVSSSMPVRPQDLYGASKCFGEALAAYFAFNEHMPCIALRIGAYIFPEEYDHFPLEELDAYLNPDDFNQLLVKSLETPGITFLIANVISNNRHKRLDLNETRKVLDYQPQADSYEIFGIPNKRAEEDMPRI